MPDTAQAAAQTKGRERYEGFVEALGRRLARGRTLADEVVSDIAAEPDSAAETRAILAIGSVRLSFYPAALSTSRSLLRSLPAPLSKQRPSPRPRGDMRGVRDVTTISSFRSEAIARGARMLRTALGPAIAGYLEDPGVVEVMLNPDGRLWIDRLAGGLEDTGAAIAPADAERIVRLVAHHVGAEVHAGSPRVSAELPESGERFEGLVPPVVAAPCFAIRQPAVAVFTLDDYVAAGIMSRRAGRPAAHAPSRTRKNILVAGGTSTGKTTLVNALLAEVAKTGDRVVLIEDTRELQCAAPNLVALRTKDGVASLSDLVRSALRLRPDRIPIGEVRGAEALDLLKAWGTGHPGGVGTIARRLRARRAAPPRAAHPGSRRHRAARADRRDHRRHRRSRRPRRATAGSPSSPQVTGLGPTGDYVLTPAGEPMMPHASRTRLAVAADLRRCFALVTAPPTRPAPTCRGSSRCSRSWNPSRGRSPRSSR